MTRLSPPATASKSPPGVRRLSVPPLGMELPFKMIHVEFHPQSRTVVEGQLPSLHIQRFGEKGVVGGNKALRMLQPVEVRPVIAPREPRQQNRLALG